MRNKSDGSGRIAQSQNDIGVARAAGGLTLFGPMSWGGQASRTYAPLTDTSTLNGMITSGIMCNCRRPIEGNSK